MIYVIYLKILHQYPETEQEFGIQNLLDYFNFYFIWIVD
jgi:hypothetical protein